MAVRIDDEPAFVLHSRPYRETSLLLECLTREHGRIGLVARGVRRERTRMPRALLQPLAPVRLGWRGQGELATLAQAEASAPPFALHGDALLCALYLNELVLRLTPRQDPNVGLFDDYLTTLQRLAVGESQGWTLRRFERDLLAHLGYALVLEADADTGEAIDPARDYIYRHEHGPVAARGGAAGLRLRGSALIALAEDTAPGSSDANALRRLMRAAIAQHLGGGELRAWQVLAAAVAERRLQAGVETAPADALDDPH